jgi:hypothetical protein
MTAGNGWDEVTTALVERWILTFCETPPLIDPDLMRRILDDHDQRRAIRGPPAGPSTSGRPVS